MQRGVARVVTDGGFRDSPDIAKLPFASYHQQPRAPTNVTVREAIANNEPIGCGDEPFFPGDLIVGGAEGVVVNPAHLAGEVAAEGVETTAFQAFVQEKSPKAVRSWACIRQPMTRVVQISRPGG